MSAVHSLERDLAACGAPLGDARALGKRYERALESGACADWVELYIGTFVTLLRSAHLTHTADPLAARRLLQFIGDDLGVQLFDEEALRRVEMALMRSAA